MSYYFNLPSYDDLNSKQKTAITDKGAVAVFGGPGTGKTVVSIWRHISNYQNKRKRSILLTYTKSLHYFIQKCIEKQARIEEDQDIENASKHVSLANSWIGEKYDEIIIDEAQDIPEYCLLKILYYKRETEGGNYVIEKKKIIHSYEYKNFMLDDEGKKIFINDKQYLLNHFHKYNQDEKGWLIKIIDNSINYIKRFADHVTYGADNRQILYPERAITEESLKNIFPQNKEHHLFNNYRNTYEILNFTKHDLQFDIDDNTLERLLAGTYKRRGSKPVLTITPSGEQQDLAILDILKEFNDGTTNIAILVPFIKDVDRFSKMLSDNNYTCNGTGLKTFSNYHNQKEHFIQIDNIHITTFKSSKGLEFDVVIIPEYDKKTHFISNFKVVNEEDYFVAYTRAVRNLFLLSSSDSDISKDVLKREIFKPVVEEESITITENFSMEDDLPF